MGAMGSTKMVDQDMINDIGKVYIQRQALTVKIGPWDHLIDVKNAKVVEVKKGQYLEYYSDLERLNTDALTGNPGENVEMKEQSPELVWREAEFEIVGQHKAAFVVDGEDAVMIID